MENKRPPFTLQESALLLDALLRIKEKPGSKRQIIRETSEALRNMARRQGIDIWDTYRNIKGIEFQMMNIDWAWTGSNGPNSRQVSSIFVKIVSLYHDDPQKFQKLLKEAREMAGLTEKGTVDPVIKTSGVSIPLSLSLSFSVKTNTETKPKTESVSRTESRTLAYSDHTAPTRSHPGEQQIRVNETNSAKTNEKDFWEWMNTKVTPDDLSLYYQYFEEYKEALQRRGRIPAGDAITALTPELTAQLKKGLSGYMPFKAGKLFSILTFIETFREERGMNRKPVYAIPTTSRLIAETAQTSDNSKWILKSGLEEMSTEERTPKRFQWRGIKGDVDSWESLYQSLLDALFRSIDRNTIYTLLRKFLVLLSSQKNVYLNSFPILNGQIYVKEEHNPDRIMKNLWRIFDYSGVDYENVKIWFEEKEHEKIRKPQPQAASQPKPVFPAVPMRNEPTAEKDTKILRILSEYFPKGYRVESAIEQKKFEKYYYECYKQPIPQPELIRKTGMLYKEWVYNPETMIPDPLKREIQTLIQRFFDDGASCVEYEVLWERFGIDFSGTAIDNTEILSVYMKTVFKNQWEIGRYYIRRNRYTFPNQAEDIRTYLMESGDSRTFFEFRKKFPQYSEQTIRAALKNRPDIIYCGDDTWIYAEPFRLEEKEHNALLELLKKGTEGGQILMVSELRKILREDENAPARSWEDFPSDTVYLDLLRFEFPNEEFAFKGNKISAGNTEINNVQIIKKFCEDNPRFDLVDLEQFGKEFGITITSYWNAIFESSIRVDPCTFVKCSETHFNISETDKVLEEICKGDFLPLSEITDFFVFPAAGFTWTKFLLESYLYKDFSKIFCLMHQNFSKSDVAGAMVRRNVGFKDYAALLARALAESECSLENKKAELWLLEKKYLLRSGYKELNSVLADAKILREKRGE